MSYEFGPDMSNHEIPVSPDHWHLKPERVFQILPFDPVFVRPATIVGDPTNRQLGIDTNDLLPRDHEISFLGDPSVGVMRIFWGELRVDGMLADLRYSSRGFERRLFFNGDGYDSDGEQNKTEPLLGAIILDPDTGALHIDSKYAAQLHASAIELLHFVDDARATVGVEIIGKQEPPTNVPTRPTFIKPSET